MPIKGYRSDIMALKPLSAFPYYGGKAKMASLICDMLDYNNTTIYIEPFGGGGRTLLNKPRHDIEIYNDAGKGLCAFMSIIGSDNAEMLIDRLYQTEYSIEEFYHALNVLNLAQNNFVDEIWRTTIEYLKHLMKKYNHSEIEQLIKILRLKKYAEIIEEYPKLLSKGTLSSREQSVLKESYIYIKRFVELVQERENNLIHEEFTNVRDEVRKELQEKKNKSINEKRIDDYAYQRIHKRAVDEIRFEMSENLVDTDDMDLAVATYIVYSQSRDGMGKSWSNKEMTTDKYHNSISKLYDVAERMKGVQVINAGALSYLMDNTYLNNPQAMFYLDPSYLKPEDETKNLGGVYHLSSDYGDHKLLLETIYKAKAKILISNYDIPLYNEYLTEQNGWSKMEYETTTTVGSVKGNKRIEVLWWNY